MPKPTQQDTIVAWLLHAGCTPYKNLTGCIVLKSPDQHGYCWYIGTGGSTRYGLTRSQSNTAPNRFAKLVGRALSDVVRDRIMPGPSVAGLEI